MEIKIHWRISCFDFHSQLFQVCIPLLFGQICPALSPREGGYRRFELVLAEGGLVSAARGHGCAELVRERKMVSKMLLVRQK